ncbi:hypothetical protein DFJ73DRAFT_756939 [Zopfochytrium polystomum]|nr:hypothetical protein DFJ73DRAFT_756939 [Zopfochytrium polystomum]
MLGAVLLVLLAPRKIANANIFYPTYFTNLSWWGMIFYYATAAYNTHVYITTNYSAARLSARPTAVRYLCWVLYVLAEVYHPIVFVVYWGVLAKSNLAGAAPAAVLANVCVHFTNLLLIAFEFVVGRVQVFYSQWVAPIGVALVYLVWSVVAHYIYTPKIEEDNLDSYPNGYWAYFFLRIDVWYSVIVYLGLTALFLGVHMFVSYIHGVRDRLRAASGKPVVPGRRQHSVVAVAVNESKV